jgi:hypothetical protein
MQQNDHPDHAEFEIYVHLKMVAYYEGLGNLPVKLKAIWDLAYQEIPKVETRLGKELKKVWGDKANKALGNDVTAEHKAFLAKQCGIDFHAQKTVTLRAYFGVLDALSQLSHKYVDLHGSGSGDHYPDRFFTQDAIKHPDYCDKVLPLFFTLQLHCHDLTRYLAAKKYVQVSEFRREATARKGGLAKGAKNYGESELMADVISYLAEQNDGAFSSRAALFQPPDGQLGKVLVEYQAGIGSPRVRGGPDITYGEDFNEESLIRKIADWARMDPRFARILNRVCGNKGK